jgi:hypothetical protein
VDHLGAHLGRLPVARLRHRRLGVGLVMNAWEVYGRMPFTEAQVQHEMQRLREP